MVKFCIHWICTSRNNSPGSCHLCVYETFRPNQQFTSTEFPLFTQSPQSHHSSFTACIRRKSNWIAPLWPRHLPTFHYNEFSPFSDARCSSIHMLIDQSRWEHVTQSISSACLELLGRAKVCILKLTSVIIYGANVICKLCIASEHRHWGVSCGFPWAISFYWDVVMNVRIPFTWRFLFRYRWFHDLTRLQFHCCFAVKIEWVNRECYYLWTFFQIRYRIKYFIEE